MAPDLSGLFAAFGILLLLDLLVIGAVLYVKARSKRRYLERSARMKRINRALVRGRLAELEAEFSAEPAAFLAQLRRLLEEARPGPAAREALEGFLTAKDLFGIAERELRRRSLPRRIEAYAVYGLSGKTEAQERLLEALRREGSRLGRLVILGEMCRLPGLPDVEGLAAELGRRGGEDLRRELRALAPLGPRLQTHFQGREPPSGAAGRGLYLIGAATEPTEADWLRLSALALEEEGEASEAAARILAETYPPRRFLEAFGAREERRFRLPSARLLGRSLSPAELAALDPWFADPELREAGIAAAGEILARHPGAEPRFLAEIANGPEARSRALSLAIEHRLPSLLYHAGETLEPGLVALAGRLVEAGRSGIVLDSLGRGMGGATKEAYLDLLKSLLPGSPALGARIARELGPELAARLGLPPARAEEDRVRIPMERRDKAFLASLVVLALALFPLAFFLLRLREIPLLSPAEILYRFVFDFQFLFAFYTIAVNSSYLVLLLLSFGKLRVQAGLWELELGGLLAPPGVLPSITILAPAYNEEKTIAESVHSLLSLNYPSYQIVVVNDGSSDGTLQALIEAFELEPAPSGAGVGGGLETLPVRLTYRSPRLPNLFVVDKANGGKADALNAGLNFATGEFVCTIDADSVLDPQALMRAMFQVLASDREVLAVGGNVFPVNGCLVEHGHLQEISLADEPLARFQTVEYLRSFVAGRLGWAVLDSLLVISGAFGLFRRSAVMELGGYLTGKGVYRRETVGEDMEIVVRLVRRDREAGRRSAVEYAYNASCWTEVPEDWKSLRRQRDRWHRGLMEVLSFHKGMAFRPRYGAPGLLGIPYFFVFDLVGPWLESLGYLVLGLALLLNLLDPLIPLLVFGIAIVFGILISVAAILLAERQILYFRTREFFGLLGVAILENFGFRQLASMGRVWSNIQVFFLSKGWQKGARKGFARVSR